MKIGSVDYSTEPPQMKYEPGHPDADENGYVRYPAVDMTIEFVDALEASRSYEANVGVIEVSKNIVEQHAANHRLIAGLPSPPRDPPSLPLETQPPHDHEHNQLPPNRRRRRRC